MHKARFAIVALCVLAANVVQGADEAAVLDPNSLASINPFTPPATHLLEREEGGGTLLLTGIMLAGPASQAILDGRLVGVGDDIRGFTVFAIEPRKVILHNDAVIEVVSLDDDLMDQGDD